MWKNVCILFFQQIGFCEGSVENSDMEQKQSVTVSCEIYGRQVRLLLILILQE